MDSKTLTNLESIGDLLGSLTGMAEGIEEDKYLEKIIKDAHGRASLSFDAAAAAFASTGKLRHMYEFGTLGITDGPVKYPDPTSPEARLWKHTITGVAGHQDIAYVFRPAINRNPQPTTRSTGVPSKYLKKLSRRKYVFWNKAFVIETGMNVKIRAKNGDYLFVPFNGEAPRNPLNQRGFMMWNSSKHGPIQTQPNQHLKSTFTAFWMNWWGSAGQDMIEIEMAKNVVRDIEYTEAQLIKSANSHQMTPVQLTNLAAAESRARGYVKRYYKGRSI